MLFAFGFWTLIGTKEVFAYRSERFFEVVNLLDMRGIFRFVCIWEPRLLIKILIIPLFCNYTVGSRINVEKFV